MLLTLLQSWPCSGLLQYTIDWVVPSIYPGTPVTVNNGQTVEISLVDNAFQKEPCCFQYRDFGTHGETDNPYTFVAGDDDVIATARLDRCDGTTPCTPRYKDIETLLQKANCLCTRIGVEAVEDFCGTGYTAFVLFDRCQPSETSMTGFHEIIAVYDPNYLLALIECLCGNQKTSSDSDYIISPVQP